MHNNKNMNRMVYIYYVYRYLVLSVCFAQGFHSVLQSFEIDSGPRSCCSRVVATYTDPVEIAVLLSNCYNLGK